MTWIIILIVLGLLLYFAELVLLPGITLAGVGAFAALAGAVAWAFIDHGTAVGLWVLGASLLCVILLTVFFLRPRTWRRMALKTESDSAVAPRIETLVAIGDRGRALTRLSPMGNVMIDGKTFEAKTLGGYVDPGAGIEVIGYDNQNVIVRPA